MRTNKFSAFLHDGLVHTFRHSSVFECYGENWFRCLWSNAPADAITGLARHRARNSRIQIMLPCVFVSLLLRQDIFPCSFPLGSV